MCLNLQQDKIVIQEFECKSLNTVNTDLEQDLCQYRMESNQQQLGATINIKFMPQESQLAKRFKVEVSFEGQREVEWLDEACREKMCLYLSELEKECNKKDADKQFRNALCIVIGEYFYKKEFDGSCPLGITEDELQQYEQLINKTIESRKKENNNFGQRLSGVNDDERKKNILFGNGEMTGDGTGVCGCLGNIWRKFCGCCIKENRNNNTKIDKGDIDNELINIS